MKACTKCKKEKDVSEFYKDKRTKSGLYSWCKNCMKESCRKYREANPKKEIERLRKYRKDNPEKVKEANRKWREANPRRGYERTAKWQKDNPEKCRKHELKWRKDNPEKASAKTRRWRARKAGLEGDFTNEEFQELCNQYGNICLCCGEEKSLAADHVIPVSWEGSTNYIDNIQPLCKTCNSRKGNRYATDYRNI